MNNKVILIGAGKGKTELLIQTMKEKYGEDIIVMTAEEVKESGLGIDEIVNKPKMKIENYALTEYIEPKPLCGKEKRRGRRKLERKNKVKR